MREEFELEGDVYSRRKGEFKGILRKHGLRWKGSMGNFEWVGKDDKVIAYFDRDERKGITLKARLVWEAKRRTDFHSDLSDWIKSLKGKPAKGMRRSWNGLRERIQRELEFWDKIHQPQVERMKSEGRPESWISKDIEIWKTRRKEKEKELKRKYA